MNTVECMIDICIKTIYFSFSLQTCHTNSVSLSGSETGISKPT